MKPVTDTTTIPHPSAHRRIADEMRLQIVSGKFPPNTQLPSTEELAASCKASYGTAHAAMMLLAREGWIERRHGAGTYVVDPSKRFVSVGIYHGIDIASGHQEHFPRSLHFFLLRGLERLKKNTQVFVDSRKHEDQKKLLPALADAINHRRIQCVIAPTINLYSARSLSRLPLPTAFLTNVSSSNTIEFDDHQFFRDSLQHLAAQGCRSAGLISNVWSNPYDGGFYEAYYESFRKTAASLGLATHRRWTQAPDKFIADLELHGYHEFKNLWQRKEGPDGLIVRPDVCVRGVILAVLEAGRENVTRNMKFVFHRNAHIPILCPFQVIWGTADEEALANGLIGIIQKQFSQEEVTPSFVPYIFSEEASTP